MLLFIKRLGNTKAARLPQFLGMDCELKKVEQGEAKLWALARRPAPATRDPLWFRNWCQMMQVRIVLSNTQSCRQSPQPPSRLPTRTSPSFSISWLPLIPSPLKSDPTQSLLLQSTQNNPPLPAQQLHLWYQGESTRRRSFSSCKAKTSGGAL